MFIFKHKPLFYSIGFMILDSDMKIIGDLGKLEKLNVSMSRITDNALQYICGLKVFVGQNCRGITDSGLRKLISSSPNLEVLDLRGYRSFVESDILKMAESTCNSRPNNVPLKVLII